MFIHKLIQSKAARSVISALAGFLVYGGWAYFINAQYSQQAGIKAALTQGTYSFVITLVLALFMEWLFERSKHRQHQFKVTFISTCLLLYITSSGVNFLLGTPEILVTILPGSIVSTVYTFSYTLALSKLQQVKT